jgi:branched-chain amino acid transport system permease protein
VTATESRPDAGLDDTAIIAPEPPPSVSTGGWVARGAVALVLAWMVLCYPGNVLSPFEVAASDANRLSEAAIFAIIGLSLNVLIGYTGTLSLGHQAFVGIGAFTSAYVVTEMTQEVILGVLVAAIIGGLQALILGLVSLRLSGLYFALVTLVYGVMAQESIFRIESFTGGTAGIDAPRPTGFESDYRYYYFALIGLAVVLFLDWRLIQTKAGRALLALRENPRVAQTWGIDTKRYTLVAFVVAGLFAGLGGGLLAHRDLRVVAEPFNFNLALVFVLMTTVGGLRNRTGVVLGSLFFALLRNGFLVDYLPGADWALDKIELTPDVAPLVLGPVLLLLVLTLLPGGFGQLAQPLQQWLGGGRFKWVPADKEVIINDVRA